MRKEKQGDKGAEATPSFRFQKLVLEGRLQGRRGLACMLSQPEYIIMRPSGNRAGRLAEQKAELAIELSPSLKWT